MVTFIGAPQGAPNDLRERPIAPFRACRQQVKGSAIVPNINSKLTCGSDEIASLPLPACGERQGEGQHHRADMPSKLTCGAYQLELDRPLVMGILNITPDSFFDGGRLLDPACALAYARQMIDDGADIIDIGGESTRPGA